MVKTYYVDEGFDTVTAACPVPIIIAGGKNFPSSTRCKSRSALSTMAPRVSTWDATFSVGKPVSNVMCRAVGGSRRSDRG